MDMPYINQYLCSKLFSDFILIAAAFTTELQIRQTAGPVRNFRHNFANHRCIRSSAAGQRRGLHFVPVLTNSPV
jgi:hypothetical protein